MGPWRDVYLTGAYELRLGISVDANATLNISHELFLDVVLDTANIKDLIFSDQLSTKGSKIDLARFFSLLDLADGNFSIVQPMGTRMLCCSDSPVHDNWKQAVLQAKETDTVFLNQESRPALRALRTERTSELATLGKFNVMEHMANLQELYFGGNMEAAIPLSGQVAGRIDEIKSAREVVEETMAGFHEVMQGLAEQYAS